MSPARCPLPGLDAELQLDRLKPKLSRRVLLLQGHQPVWQGTLALAPGTPPQCHNLTAFLRVWGQGQRGRGQRGPQPRRVGDRGGDSGLPSGDGDRDGDSGIPRRVGDWDGDS